MNKEELLRTAILKLAKLYRRRMDSDVVEMYISALRGRDIKQVMQAMKVIIETKTFMPSIAEIIECIPKKKLELVKNVEPTNFDLQKEEAGRIMNLLKGRQNG